MTDYFTDREFGARVRTSEIIEDALWGGIHSLVETRIDDGSFGYRYPAACVDVGRGSYGCDRGNFFRAAEALIPGLGRMLPLRPNRSPETPVVLDLLQFCAEAVGEPIAGAWHDYSKHTHLTWDRGLGLARFVTDVNDMFVRNGVAFELTAQGRAQRILPASLEAIVRARFRTGDVVTDQLLENARLRIIAPRLEDRRDGLEKLWDAFERIKTLHPGADTRVTADALLDMAARPGSRLRSALGAEASALTTIGNGHLIRHSEVRQEPLETALQVDYLFARLFAFLHFVLRASGWAD